MRAITLGSFGGIDALSFSDWPDPVPSPSDEVVTIKAVALGPWDLSATQGAFAGAGGSTSFPQQQGWDFAGETTSGRRVIGFVAQPWMGIGTLAERIAVASSLLTELPEALSWAQGASLPVCSLTARLLIDGAGVSEGDRVAVTGAAGMVGGFAVELARAAGATVAGVVRDTDAEEARRLGVDATVVAGEDMGRLLGEWAPGGVNVCLDTVGAGAAALAGIRDGGRLISTVPGSLPETTRGITADVVQVQPNPAALESLVDSAADGRLTVRVAETLPWTEYRRGYQLLQAGGLRGKIVLIL